MTDPRPLNPLLADKAQVLLRAWNESQRPYRGCDLCVSKAKGVEGDWCNKEGEKLAPVAQARGLGGHCGPEASALYIATWGDAPKPLPSIFDPHTATGFK